MSASPALRKPPFLIRDVRYFSPRPHSTRWSDNDVYGHLNKFAMLLEALLTAAARGTVLCHFFDSISNEFLISHCGLDTASTSAPIGLMVSSKIDFRRSVSYPEPVIAGLSIAKLGKTSVTYRVGVWAAHVADTRRFDSPPAEWHGLEPVNDDASAEGELTHVFVDPKTRRPVPLPDSFRTPLSRILLNGAPQAKL